MKLPPFDPYYYYSQSVQSPSEDMKFLDQVYLDARGKRKSPQSLREDFCAAFLNCCAWIHRGSKRIAHGVDLDPEPLNYGRTHYLTKLDKKQADRIHLHQKNVMSSSLPKVDMICALNFSYFIFKERQLLKKYFQNCLRTLQKDGVLVLDCFGGPKCWETVEEETVYDDHDPKFSYFWDHDYIDPLSHHAKFFIHFKRKGEAKRKNIFSYDWRIWTVPELNDLLLECGFSKVNLYWEGTTEDGDGDGEFVLVDKAEECESWVCYLAALK